MRGRHALLILPLCLGTLLIGCATIFAGKGPVEIPTASTPPGAEVYLDGNRLGTTPVKVKVERKKAQTLVFKKSGFKDASCVLEKSTGAGWVILDVVFGLVPVVVDAVTGDWSSVKGTCTMVLDKVP